VGAVDSVFEVDIGEAPSLLELASADVRFHHGTPVEALRR
jgi:hypothetical protein